MLAHHPRRAAAALFCFFLVAATAGPGDAAAPPAPSVLSSYEGTWAVLVPNERIDITFWLVRIEKGAKKVSVVSGINQYKDSKLTGVKADEKSISFTMTTQIPKGTERLVLTAMPPRDARREQMLGAVLVRGALRAVWLHKTTLTELTQRNAARVTPGFPEIEEALKRGDTKEKVKDLQAVAAKYPTQPVHFLALQARMSEYIKQNADPAVLRQAVGEYRRLAAGHGPEFLAGSNLDLARNLMDHPRTLPLAVESAREAVKALRADHHMALRISANLTLAAGLYKSKKAGEIKPVVAEVDRLCVQSMAKLKGQSAEAAALQQFAVLMLASPSPEVADLGLSYTRRAVGLLKDDMPLPVRAGMYNLLLRALEARGKNDEAKALAPKVEKLDTELDQAYLKETVRFDVEKSKGRKGASDRVVLVELFTDMQYKPTVAGSIAFDASLRRYPPNEAVFLQYYIAHPNPSPLVNRDSEARKAFYTADLEGVPAMFVDGKLTPSLGGAEPRGKEAFDLAKEAIDAALEVAPMAKIKLEVTRKGEAISARADVSALKSTGPNVRLRFALVEQRVRYTGANGVRLHHHVLRAFPGGDAGFKLEKPEATHEATVTLPAVRKQLTETIAESAKKLKATWVQVPIGLQKLKVIAWVQDEDSKQVYNAAQADVPAK